MRYRRVCRFLILSIILALLGLLFPSPAQAIPKLVYLQPSKGKIGDWIGVNVYYFSAAKAVDIYLSSDKAGVDDVIGGKVTAYQHIVTDSTVAEGRFPLVRYFIVPDRLTDGEDKEDLHGGEYYVYATYHPSTTIVCVATFTVIDGEIEIDPEEGVVGSEVEISGEGLRPNQKISVEYDGEEVDIISGDDETDGKGQFVCAIIIPESIVGEHTITVIDESGDRPEAEFGVKIQMTLTPSEQAIGGVVEVRGTGFPEDEAITLVIGGRRIDTTPPSLITDHLGSFNCSFVVPFFDSCGERNVGVDDSEGVRLVDVQLAVLAGITLSSTNPASPGHVGMDVTVRGIGFGAKADVIIAYTIDDEAIPVATAMTDDNGNLSAEFTVPPSIAGSHLVTATDGMTSTTSTFTMESQAPPMPRLLLPEIGSTLPAEAYFDWEDVTDPSGVSYTLQVATDANFTNIVLVREGLPHSEYAMGEGERLASTKADAPYYWRVRAVDGASNEGDWSLPVLFYVGFSWISNWVGYIFYGLGVLLLVIGLIWWLRWHAGQSKPK
jgi:hypothetical protein